MVASDERALVTAQVGRTPREPWRVAARCGFGYPTVIVSPSRLADGTPFPTWAWLTCPWLTEETSALESAGACARYTDLLRESPALAERMRALDASVRECRARESGGVDECAPVGLAGQRDPLGVKCVHAAVALSLAGLDNPIGDDVLAGLPDDCGDGRCASLVTEAPSR